MPWSASAERRPKAAYCHCRYFGHVVASIFWWVALVMILLFGWILLSHWLLERQNINEVTPAWLLPVLGPITIPIAGNVLQNPGFHGNTEHLLVQVLFAQAIGEAVK